MTGRYQFSDNLGYLLNRCAGQMARRFERELEPYGISLAQWGALLAIHEKGEASPSDVATRVGIDRGATTRLIARMEEKGLLTRRMNEADGRSVVLALSPETAALMPTLVAASREVNRAALAKLPEAERAALLAALSSLLDRLKD